MLSNEDWRRNDMRTIRDPRERQGILLYVCSDSATCMVMSHELDVGWKTFLSISHLQKAVFYIHHYFYYNNRVAPSQFESMFDLHLTFFYLF